MAHLPLLRKVKRCQNLGANMSETADFAPTDLRAKSQIVPPPSTADNHYPAGAALGRACDPSEVPILSIVAPCFNEEGCIVEFYRRASAAARASVGPSFEIILVNDGSRDQTASLLHELGKTEPALIAINLSRNFGHQRALSAGLMYSRGERVLIIDADLQDPPELLAEMMQSMDDGADVVYGQRRSRAGETWFKLATAKGFYRILSYLADIDIPRATGDFRLMNRKTVDVFNKFPEQFRFIRGLISWIGFDQRPILYDRASRMTGETGYTFGKMLRLAVDAVTSFSVVPLRLASYLGFLGGLAGVLLLAYSIGSWFFGATAQGWTSLLSIILVMGSMQMIVLGIMGEYVGRLYLESKARPLFVVKDVLTYHPNVASDAQKAPRNVHCHS